MDIDLSNLMKIQIKMRIYIDGLSVVL